MQLSQPLRALSGVQVPAGNSSVTSRVRQSRVTVISALVAPAMGAMLASTLVWRLARGSVNEESNSPLALMATERKLEAGSLTISGFSFTFQPQCGRQLRSKRTSGVLVMVPGAGGRRSSKAASGGALKSSIV